MKTILTFFLVGAILACSNKIVTQDANQVELLKDRVYDFTAIGEAVKEKHIVALGESSHGIGEYYAFKAALVEYLHENHGFEVLAFEAGLGDLNLAYSNIDSLSTADLLNKTLFGNFRCEEIEPLFDHIKSTSHSDRPLIYTGFDNQFSSSYFQNSILPVLNQYDPELGAKLDYALDGYVRWFRAGYYQDSIKYELEAKSFNNTADRIRSIFAKNKKAIQSRYSLTDNDFKFIDQTCVGFKRTVSLPYEDKQRGSAHRDRIMFDNFKWLVKEIYPNKKVIIWAHNSHIEQASDYEYSYKWMGHYLNEKYGEDYYALGLFAQQGEAYQQWGDTVITLDNTDPSMLESLMMKSGHQVSFLDLSQIDSINEMYPWINESVEAFENENGGKISFVPRTRFDGIVVMREVKSPSY